jgi:cell division protein FtsB
MDWMSLMPSVSKYLPFGFNIIMMAMMISFAMQLINADEGLMSLRPLDDDIVTTTSELNNLKLEETYLRKKVSLLSPETVDPDLLGELARQKNGLYDNNEVVIFID